MNAHHLFSRYALYLALLVPPAAGMAETFSPHFFSPKRTGDCYWFEDKRTVSNATLVTENAKVISQDKSIFDSQLEANVTVIRNNASGKAIEERFEVLHFTVTEDGGEPKEMLEPGTIFYGRLELGEKIFTRPDGDEISPMATLFLQQIIALRDNSITDEDIFAPDEPVAIGDTWPVNARLAADDFNFDMSLQADPRYLKGGTTLIDAPVIDGKPYVHVVSEMELTRAQLPRTAGLKTIKGDLSFKSEAWLPQEGPVYPREQRMQMEITFIAEPFVQREFAKRRMMANSSISAVLKSKPLPRDESVTELDRTLGIRR